MSHAGTLLNISFRFTYQWFCFAEIVPSFNSKAQNWARTVQQEHSYDAARLIYFLRHYVRSDFGMCTVFMNMLHFAVRWESRKQQCPTCHLLQGQRKLGSSLHASVQSAGSVFWTLKTVQCMKPSSPLNQTNSEHIVYLFCLKQETVSIQLELLEVPQSFLQWSVWVLPPLNSRFMENKQGKDNLQKYPLTSNKENMQWLLYLQEPFILTIYFQMCTETPRFEKSLHLWTQKNKC